MSRYIDADVAKSNIASVFTGASEFAQDTRNAACKAIDAAPTADVEPVRWGTWIPVYEGASTCECSACGKVGFKDSDFGFIESNYCPNCGVRMDADK